MKTVWNILISLIILNISVEGQNNLVLNYSFEDTISCPLVKTEIEKAKHWFQPLPSSTSDYIHICQNYWGAVFSYSVDDAFARIDLFDGTSYNYREYIQTKLSEPLLKNKKYCVEIDVAPNQYGWAVTDAIGAYFSDTLVHQQIPERLDVIPQFHNSSGIIDDTLNWTTITGSFIAQGGEQYMTIGNFTKGNQVNYYQTGWGVGCCCHNIDNVKVYYCGPDTTPEPPIPPLVIPNVFTPNNDGYNDVFEIGNAEFYEIEITIFNRWQQVVFHSNENTFWDGTIKGNQASDGVYFYNITSKLNDKIESFWGSISLFRH